MIKSIITALGIEFSTLFLDDVKIDNVIAYPITRELEITENAIDGDRNTDVTTYTKEELQEYEITAFFQAGNGGNKRDFEKINAIFDEKKVFNFTGSKFDDRDFLIKRLTINNEGYNYINFTFVAREVQFAEIKKFTEQSKNIPQNKNTKKPQKTTKKATVKSNVTVAPATY